jgi:hypothetical protein
MHPTKSKGGSMPYEKIRTGARSVLNLLKLACRLTHTTGFRTGIIRILGPESATDFFSVWDAACPIIEAIVTADNYYNKIDKTPERTGDEDVAVE